MNIFLSYASENRDVADSIALGLREEGHEVFFDRDSLPAGSSYDDRIRDALDKAQLFIFLISPDSIDQGSYTLTELKFARQRWKKASGHVLPVMIEATDYDEIPSYLRAVTVLEPSGNTVAEVLARVAKLSSLKKRKWYALLAIPVVLAVLAVMIYFLRPADEWIVQGQVLDLTNDAPIPGVVVTVFARGEPLMTGNSSVNGEFKLTFNSKTFSQKPQNLNLQITHADFATFSGKLIINNDELEKDTYDVKLFPKNLIKCQFRKEGKKRPGVVIGHFYIKKDHTLEDLSRRIAFALMYDLKYILLTQLQEIHVPSDFQPEFVDCQHAKPRSINSGGLLSKALGADAFISGDVSLEDDGYAIRTYISDSFELFDPPLRTENRGVDLDDPGAAHLAPGTHANIMIAIASGYKNSERFEDCIDVSVAAERVIGKLTPAIALIRKECQQEVPHQGLLRGDRS